MRGTSNAPQYQTGIDSTTDLIGSSRGWKRNSPPAPPVRSLPPPLLIPLDQIGRPIFIGHRRSSIENHGGTQNGRSACDKAVRAAASIFVIGVVLVSKNVGASELSADKRVTGEMAIEIASRFFGPGDEAHPKALQKILYRHEKLMDSRAASESIGGKANYA